MTYIQYKYQNQPLETLDQFESYKEALRCLKEYRLSDPYGTYYLSSRACKGWKQDDEN